MFQYSIDVMSQKAVIVAMVGVNGSFVFVEQGQESRDKFMSSGQNVAIKGEVVGYYLFKRCDANQRAA